MFRRVTEVDKKGKDFLSWQLIITLLGKEEEEDAQEEQDVQEEERSTGKKILKTHIWNSQRHT